ncbi:MAG TPA: protein kinase, partial [Gemmatimonadales bacterium]|nr:protein kinase [Gemmatimonadales bacterium]
MTESARQDASPADPAAAGRVRLEEQLRAATTGEYDIYGELGLGGMATVYLAHEVALDRKVAIKVMSPGLVHGPGMVERFKREARTAAHLSHPNIIPVYAVREADGLLFFVMKLVEGTPLDAVMRELGKLPLPMVEAILAQVGGAFGYAHRHGVVHRDIKPSNILIDDEGWAVVTDFGIAKVMENEGLTQSGVAVGTPTYMSPEQCGGGVITGASDQYSLGVVAYEMLSGRPPFTGTSMMSLMYSHFHDPAPPLQLYRPDCPEPMRAAVMRMLEKDPADRWPSMEDAVAAMGARHLAHDDPTRSQLISVARTGAMHRLISQVQTPRSPVPLTKQTPVAPVASTGLSRLPRWILPVTGVVAVGAAVAAVMLSRTGSPTAGPGTSPDSAESTSRSVLPSPPAVDSATTRTSPSPGVGQPEAAQETGAGRRAAASVTARARGNEGSAKQASPPSPGRTPTVETAANAAQPERKVDTQPAAPIVPAPSPPAPEPVTPLRSTTEPPPAVKPVDERAAVESAIMTYARALEAGNLAEARRMYPGMPTEQRQGLEAFWQAGGTMKPRWTVDEVAITGDRATARILGSNLVTTARARPSE